jgi:GH25 family lysozyme M1 (1,4-beta-N-acetylmuramidase)
MPFHFFRFAADPTVQAEHFVKTTGGVQVGELPHCLDLEWDNTPDAPKQYNDGGEIDEAGAQLALTFLEKLETLTGVIPVVYTASGFFPGSASPATVEKFARYLLWVAHYNVNAPRIPKPWLNYAFWQYTSSGEVPGTGKVDCSWYNGSEADLKALLKT